MGDHWYSPAALAGAGILWPALIVAAALLWPGPTVPAGYVSAPDMRQTAGVLPATDLSGSTTVFTEDDGAASGRVFWEVPEPGRVHITIELDPAQRTDTAGAQGPDGGAADQKSTPE